MNSSVESESAETCSPHLSENRHYRRLTRLAKCDWGKVVPELVTCLVPHPLRSSENKYLGIEKFQQV